MESEFVCQELFHALKAEWRKTDWDWGKFIETKDLGVDWNSYGNDTDTYRVTDPKKWILSRLKYGI